MNWAMLAAFGGIILGLIGAVLGIVFTFKKSGQEEKKYLKLMIGILWIAGVLLVLGIVFLPRPYSFYLFVPYAAFVPVFIVNSGRRIKRLRDDVSGSDRTLESATDAD